MSYVIGIDTGGTYTDAVLLDSEIQGPDCIRKKAKDFTTHQHLETGIRGSLVNLMLTQEEIGRIEKVVLSTTLATNAIVEGNVDKVGLLLIGSEPKGDLATDLIRIVPGEMNIKGRVFSNTNREATLRAADELVKEVGSIAISGPYSTRNPVMEEEVRRYVREKYKLPIVCAHDLVNNLGYLERTNTAIINAGLLPVIERFTQAIRNVLGELGIEAPIFVVRGDGSIATLEAIGEKPVDTVLSGPASSMTGTIRLTHVEDGIIADMGGTTTDSGLIRDGRVALSPNGATVGGWKLWIKSARLITFGLGGDSEFKYENGALTAGPRRVLPAARGGAGNVTPTDLVHHTGEFERWDKALSEIEITKMAQAMNLSNDEFVKQAEKTVTGMIYEGCVREDEDLKVPVCAIGAPAETWYKKAQEEYGFDLIVPENYEVANAAGAAASGIEETLEAIVRVGEEGYGYLIHSGVEREAVRDKQDAINRALALVEELGRKRITDQNLEVDTITFQGEEIWATRAGVLHREIPVEGGHYELNEDELNAGDRYLETRIKAVVSGRIFKKQ